MEGRHLNVPPTFTCLSELSSQTSKPLEHDDNRPLVLTVLLFTFQHIQQTTPDGDADFYSLPHVLAM